MWREYTRETPAKPGWAIASAGAALALTTGLAWVLAHQGVASSTLGSSLEPRYWPISFACPPALSRFANGIGLVWERIPAAISVCWPTSSPGQMTATPLRSYSCTKFAKMHSDLQDEKFGFSSADFAEGEPIDMGGMEARMLAGYLPTHELLFSAVGLIEEGELGLVIRIQMTCPPETRGAERLFRGCPAGQFRDWYLPSYMDMYDDFAASTTQ